MILSAGVNAQLTVTAGGGTAAVTSAIAGPGLTVSGVTINCGATSYGAFTGGGPAFGMNNGLMLTTGDASQVVGPNAANDLNFCVGSSASDPQLTALSTQATYDPCIIEFDVIPQCNSMTITFVFGSDEYLDYVSLGFNDAFGFFVTGPNPAGGSYTNLNIATIPGGTPVSIDNVNNVSNPAYYVNTPADPLQSFDGHTTVLSPVLAVTPCASYHFKLAIADASDCLMDSGVLIDLIQCVSPWTVSTSSVPASCGLPNGSATATVTGGIGPFTYSWSPSGGTGSTATGLVAGTYNVTVNDGLSCTPAQVVSVTVGSTGAAPIVSVTPSTGICNGGSTSLTASGASTYTWSPATGLSATTGATVTASPTTTTTYTVTGTAACGSGTATTTITVNPIPTITSPAASKCASAPAVTLTASGAATYTWSPATGLSATTGASVTANPAATTTYTITGTSAAGCVGTGTVTLTVNPNPVVASTPATICNGSSTPLTATGASTYTWSPATGLSATTGATVNASPTTTTTYTITGTSAAGCTGTANVTVTVNPLPTVSSPAATICSGASTTLTASGAATYTWSPATGLSATTGASVTANPAATTTYTITGTSAAGCVSTGTVTVTVNPLPTVSSPAATICSGASTTLTASGAATYTWSPATGLSATTGASVTANPAATTTYTITGTSAAGCVSTGTVMVTVNPIPVIIVNSPSICPGGSTTLNASGATSYTWSPATGLSATTGASVTANPVSTTTYTVSGTTAGCTGTATSTVTVGAVLTPVVNSATICNGLSASLTATGATTYTWSPATGLSATTGSSVTANPTTTTTYTVTGTTGACSGSTTTTVTVNPLPTITSPAATICNGASATLTASGASTYTWSPATGLSATTGTSVSSSATSTTTYTITGTDINGCVSTGTVTLTVNPNPVVVVNSGNICAGSSIVLNATGATTYTWSPATGLSATTGASVNASPAATTTYTVTGTSLGCNGTATSTVTVVAMLDPTITPQPALCESAAPIIFVAVDAGGTWSATCGACINSATGTFDPSVATAGTYTITYTIPGACGGTDTETIIVNPDADASFTVTSPLCTSSAPVTFTPTQPGGTWSATCGACINSATGVFDPSLATIGTNTITYTIGGPCGASSTNTVDVQAISITSIDTTEVLCNGGSNGTITITATGATGYSIDGGTTFLASNVFSVSAGVYNIVVQNAIGCQATGTATVTEPSVLTIAAGTLQNETCVGMCDGQVAALPSGGAGGYIVNWTGPSGGIGLSLTNVCSGAYTATVTDVNGCTAAASTNVTGAIAVTIVSATPTNPTCNGGTNGQLVIVGSATVTQYSIDNGATFQATGTFTGLAAGPYVVVVTDANGCSATQNITLTQPTALSVTSSPNVNICMGSNTTISATGAGGTGPYNYQWDDPTNATTAAVNVSPAATTTYNVVVTDANGCGPVNESVTVTVGAPLNVIALTNQTICPGASVNISANASGGGGVYNYSWSNNINASVLSGQNQTVTPSVTTIYTVTLTDNCGTPSVTDNITITVLALPAVNIAANVTQGCSPVVVNFTNSTAGVSSCSWDFGDGTTSVNCNETHVFTSPGCYNITFNASTTVGGCPVDTTINNMICVYAIPVADFVASPQPTNIYNTIINFTNTSVGANSYNWNFAGLGTGNSMNPTFEFPSDSGGTYPICLNVVSAQGCIDSVCHDVVINGEFLIYVPNAFTPDGDGINDVFLPIVRGEDPTSYELMIFDRWGELIFQSNNKVIGWDGTHNNTKSKEDVYVWKVKVKKKENEDKLQYIGHVTLLR